MLGPSLKNERYLRRWGLGACGVLVLCLACRNETPEKARESEPARAPASAEPARVFRPAQKAPLRCEELRAPREPEAPFAETVELASIEAEKKIVLSKTGVVAQFARDDALQVARCLKLEQAVRYIEQETGHVPESPLVDAFQMSYVAAALLDSGRANIRREDETTFRKTFVRDGWAAVGCGGRCRSFGRMYRLAEDEPLFFFRVTDKTKNDWE